MAPTKVVAERVLKQELFEGRRIGAYEIGRCLGRGGMGSVYLATRADAAFHKRVAIKVLRRDLEDADELVRRFRTERQILAGLEHPNIAQLLDGGTTGDGRPYLVMEYVAGMAIDRYCEVNDLSVRRRLELFCTVCAAVHFAHQNLIVHRDIKPGNILVTADGVPKLLDFGIAKLLNPDLASSSQVLAMTAMAPMTPSYASPEQIRGDPITTATDVYSLGVMLFRLLTGRLPYDLEGLAPFDVGPVIVGTTPERPSTVVRRRAREAEPPADGRDFRRLRRRLRGDVDNIVLMALRKEPRRRYASAEQLAADIRRHLDGLPVLARKATMAYRVGKFVERHRLATAAVLAALLVISALVFQIATERNEARVERDRAERVTELLIEFFQVSDPTGETVDALDILDEAERRLGTELADQPEVRARLSDTLGVIFKNLGHFDRARPLLESALELRRRLYGEASPQVAASLHHLALLDGEAGDYERSVERFERALDLRRRLLGERDPAVAETLDDFGLLLYARGDYERAEALHREALEIRRERLGEHHHEVAESLQHLAADLHRRHDLDASEELYRQALVLLRELFGDDHYKVAMALNDFGVLLHTQRSFEEAESVLRDALEIRRRRLGEHPEVADTANNLAATLVELDRPDEAEPLYQEALALRRRFFGADHPLVANTLYLVGRFEIDRGRFGVAEVLIRESLDILSDKFAADDWRLAVVEATYGRCLIEARSFSGAERALLHAHQVLATQNGVEHPSAQRAVEFLVLLYERWDRPLEAERFRVLRAR